MAAKDVNYFELFVKGAQVCHKAAERLCIMLSGTSDYSEDIAAIHNIEREGDELYHKIYEHLNRSFITPIEREDIIDISMNIERTIDAIDEVSIMFNMLSVTKVRSEAKELADMIAKSCGHLVEATKEFSHFKKSKKLMPILIEINHIEEEGDRLYQTSMKKLFSLEKDPLEVIKWKSIFDVMENVLDTCENVADVMEGVIIKNS